MLMLNTMGSHRRKFELHLDIVVGAEDMADAVDSITEYINDHAEEILAEIPMENTGDK